MFQCDELKPYIFISYSSQDADIVRKDADELSARGVNIWVDEELNKAIGEKWDDKVLLAMKNPRCKACFLYVSEHSMISNAVRRELFFTKSEVVKRTHAKKAIPIYPIELENINDITEWIQVELVDKYYSSEEPNPEEDFLPAHENATEIGDEFFPDNSVKRFKFSTVHDENFYEQLFFSISEQLPEVINRQELVQQALEQTQKEAEKIREKAAIEAQKIADAIKQKAVEEAKLQIEEEKRKAEEESKRAESLLAEAKKQADLMLEQAKKQAAKLMKQQTEEQKAEKEAAVQKAIEVVAQAATAQAEQKAAEQEDTEQELSQRESLSPEDCDREKRLQRLKAEIKTLYKNTPYYDSENMTDKLWKSIHRKISEEADRNDLLFFLDTSVWANGKGGILVTDSALYYATIGAKGKISFDDVRGMYLDMADTCYAYAIDAKGEMESRFLNSEARASVIVFNIVEKVLYEIKYKEAYHLPLENFKVPQQEYEWTGNWDEDIRHIFRSLILENKKCACFTKQEDIPDDLWMTASQNYAKSIEREDVLFLYDRDGSGKGGYVVTRNGFYSKEGLLDTAIEVLFDRDIYAFKNSKPDYRKAVLGKDGTLRQLCDDGKATRSEIYNELYAYLRKRK